MKEKINNKELQLAAIPEIFQDSAQPVGTQVLANIQSDSHWTEFVAHLTQFNEMAVPDTKEQLELLLQHEADPANRSALYTGIARCLIGEGQFITAVQTLGYAYSLLTESDREEHAFVLLEMVAFLIIVGSYDNALMILKLIPGLTHSEYLLRIANYYELVNSARKGNYSVLDELLKSAEYFQSVQQDSTLAYHYKNIGNIYGKLKDFETARQYYNKALKLTEKHKYLHIQTAINHDLGMMFYRKGEFDEAVKILSKTAKKADSFYTQSYTLGNIGFLYFQKNDFEKADLYFQQALDIASTNGVFHLVPSACYFLGESSERTNKLELAKYFYEKGYQLAIELVRRKFPLKGERLRVINAYVRYLKEHQYVKPENPTDYDFSFAIDKTLQEIRATFQDALLDVMLRRTGSVKQVIDKLEIAQRTYSKVRSRVKNLKANVTPESILLFINHNEQLSWKKINKKFDDSILSYLHNHYSLNKKKLSEKLQVNYPRLVTRFKQIDQSKFIRNNEIV